jgi:hypothetical protein
MHRFAHHTIMVLIKTMIARKPSTPPGAGQPGRHGQCRLVTGGMLAALSWVTHGSHGSESTAVAAKLFFKPKLQNQMVSESGELGPADSPPESGPVTKE